MQKAKYRISKVRIEGFRGFTAPQSIDLNGHNLFVFGANGQGKSSIVEAVRWCLFGAPAGGDIEVRNTFYDQQECRVSLELRGAQGSLAVTRELRPGHERSRQTIRDSGGSDLRARDALPQLARLGHHEGTQVIFAAQHAAGRQVPADISNFRNILCFYLRLEDVPSLIDALKRLEEEREEEAEDLARQIEGVEEARKDALHEVQTRLAGVLENPPWGERDGPTGAETADRIHALVQELARQFQQEMPAESHQAAALTTAERWVEAAAGQESARLQTQRDELAERVGLAEEIVARLEETSVGLDAKRSRKVELDERLAKALAGEAREAIRDRYARLEQSLSDREARCAIARRAFEYCQEHTASACPACGKESDPAALLRAAEAEASASEEDAAQAEVLEVLRERVEAIQEVETELAPLESGIEDDERAVKGAHEEFAQLLDLNQAVVTIEEARSSVAQLTEDVDALDLRIVDGEAAKDRAIRRIRDLQVESKYHDLRDRAAHLEWFLDTGMEDARSLLRDYRSLLDTTRHLRALLEREFRKALDRAIPVLDEMFTDVYRRLTRQSSYDLVRVYHDPERAGALELRVASGRLPGQSFPANVLNGQASKALHLVPYFVFSRFQPALMELDLLLIDDPSESFDTSHVGMLVDQLAQAAQHAQLVVASHEEEKFESYLAERFKEEPYLEVRVTGFDPLTGPELAAT